MKIFSRFGGSKPSPFKSKNTNKDTKDLTQKDVASTPAEQVTLFSNKKSPRITEDGTSSQEIEEEKRQVTLEALQSFDTVQTFDANDSTSNDNDDNLDEPLCFHHIVNAAADDTDMSGSSKQELEPQDQDSTKSKKKKDKKDKKKSKKEDKTEKKKSNSKKGHKEGYIAAEEENKAAQESQSKSMDKKDKKDKKKDKKDSKKDKKKGKKSKSRDSVDDDASQEAEGLINGGALCTDNTIRSCNNNSGSVCDTASLSSNTYDNCLTNPSRSSCTVTTDPESFKARTSENIDNDTKDDDESENCSVSSHNSSRSDSSTDSSTNAGGQRGGSKKESAKVMSDEELWATWKPKYEYSETKTSGNFQYMSLGKTKVVEGKSIHKGIELFKANPSKYIAMTYQTSVRGWLPKKHKYTLYFRKDTIKLEPLPVKGDEKAWMTVLMQEYRHLPHFANNELPCGDKYKDTFTDTMTYRGKPVHDWVRNKPILPGRGMGCGCDDLSTLALWHNIDPCDIRQGFTVGDCWLMSAISALAEFPGIIKRLFRKTEHLEQRPLAMPNMYTVTLYDLRTWEEVDVVIDERLASAPDGTSLLGAKPSHDGGLWVPYLEKALAAHCGGWDNLHGGRCSHAWALMTGCREQFTIWKHPGQDKYFCHSRFNPNSNKWVKHTNNPKDGLFGKVWPAAWPGEEGDKEDYEYRSRGLSMDELFMKLYEFDQKDYIVASCTSNAANAIDEGMVDEHAYTVIQVVHNAADTGIDLFKVRNPWGKGEMEDGEFDDNGPGWEKYPEIKALLNPVEADDGIFYVTKEEFFQMYETVFISASSMSQYKE